MNDSRTDIELLYAEIGLALSSGTLGVDSSDNNHAERGKNWFSAHRSDIEKKICGSEVRNKLDAKTDEEQTIMVIADAVSAITFGVPAASVARLITKIGLTRFCRWESN